MQRATWLACASDEVVYLRFVCLFSVKHEKAVYVKGIWLELTSESLLCAEELIDLGTDFVSSQASTSIFSVGIILLPGGIRMDRFCIPHEVLGVAPTPVPASKAIWRMDMRPAESFLELVYCT